MLSEVGAVVSARAVAVHFVTVVLVSVLPTAQMKAPQHLRHAQETRHQTRLPPRIAPVLLFDEFGFCELSSLNIVQLVLDRKFNLAQCNSSQYT